MMTCVSHTHLPHSSVCVCFSDQFCVCHRFSHTVQYSDSETVPWLDFSVPWTIRTLFTPMTSFGVLLWWIWTGFSSFFLSTNWLWNSVWWRGTSVSFRGQRSQTRSAVRTRPGKNRTYSMKIMKPVFMMSCFSDEATQNGCRDGSNVVSNVTVGLPQTITTICFSFLVTLHKSHLLTLVNAIYFYSMY